MIELKDESLSPHVFKVVMDSIYTGELQINKEKLRNVLQQCCDFLLTEIIQSARFDVQMYCYVWTITDRHSLREVKEAADSQDGIHVYRC